MNQAMTMIQHNSVRSADEGFSLGRVAVLVDKNMANNSAELLVSNTYNEEVMICLQIS